MAITDEFVFATLCYRRASVGDTGSGGTSTDAVPRLCQATAPTQQAPNQTGQTY